MQSRPCESRTTRASRLRFEEMNGDIDRNPDFSLSPDRHIQLHSDLPPPRAIDPIMALMSTAFDPLYGEAWNRRQTYAMLNLPLCRSILAIADRTTPAGFAMSRRVSDEEELLLIAVRPELRQSGVGNLIMSQILRSASDDGIANIFLEVRSNNPAIRFYQGFGFCQVGLRSNYYVGADGQSYDALTYTRKV